MQLRFAREGERPLALPGHANQGVPAVHTWRTQTEAVIAHGFRQDGWYWMYWPSLATFRFSKDEPFITVFEEPGVSRDLIADTYKRSVLPMALQALGHEALHASAVVAASGVVAFAARSKTGKSTVAFALNRRGYQQWADDGVVLAVDGGRVVAVPLPFDVRLRPEASGMFGFDASKFHRFEPEEPPDPRARRPTPLSAICLLSNSISESSGVPATIERLQPVDAFAPVLVHAHEFNPFDLERRKQMLQAYLDLVALVPVFEVRFRPGCRDFSRVLDTIVRSIGLEHPIEQPEPVA